MPYPTQESYGGLLKPHDTLFDASGHPTQPQLEAIRGHFVLGGSLSACSGGVETHVLTGSQPCRESARGCSCVVLEVTTEEGGKRLQDVPAQGSSLWSGWRLQVVSGPLAGYEGVISYNAAGRYNIIPALSSLLAEGSHFLLSDPHARKTPAVPQNVMWVFGGVDELDSVSNQLFALSTAGNGLTVAAAYDRKVWAVEDYVYGTQNWVGVSATSICGEFGTILGGYQQLGYRSSISKLYSISSSHTAVSLSFDFIKIDLWQGATAQLLVDQTLVWSQSLYSNITDRNECGEQAAGGLLGERRIKVNVTLPHNSSTLRLTINVTSADPNELDLWWGIKGMRVRTLPRGFSWSEVKQEGARPEARSHHAAVMFQERMFLFGGRVPSQVLPVQESLLPYLNLSLQLDVKLGDFFSFNTSSNVWTSLSSLPDLPAARSHHTLVADGGDNLILFGGQAQLGLLLNDLSVFSVRSQRWKRPVALGQPPAPRAGHAAAVKGGRMWVYGGMEMELVSKSVRLLGDVHYLTLSDLTWRQVASDVSIPDRLAHVMVAMLTGSLYVLAGATGKSRNVTLLGDVQRMEVKCGEGRRKELYPNRSFLDCDSMRESEAVQARIRWLQTQGTRQMLQVEEQLTAAYQAARMAELQHERDRSWFDGQLTDYTTNINALITEGKIYTQRLSLLQQARDFRAVLELQYVEQMQGLESAKRALEMRRDELREQLAATLQELEVTDGVLTKKALAGALSAGAGHACAVNVNDGVQCWGLNDARQSEGPAGKFEQVTAGDHFSCALSLFSRHPVCWGSNSFQRASPPPSLVALQISAGAAHVCLLLSNRSIACFGDNREGQLRNPPSSNFVMISSGSMHSCALEAVDAEDVTRRRGAVRCWGKNTDGQARAPAGKFTWVSAGWKHSCAIDEKKQMVCWGSNEFGQASNVSGYFTSVSAGGRHSCAVKANGGGLCWGRNLEGQAAAPNRRFEAMAAGQDFSCGIDANKRQVICWGARSTTTPFVPSCTRVWIRR
mmetsp:Transcript_18597/g.61081  ORF Transcript_18597/g.61081 Transcript_18597/m.61081 type:complete len:1012 (-) Transcript_18597:1981-5016(-)